MTIVFDRRSATEAFAWVDALHRVHGVETLPLAAAGGRILSRTLTTSTDLPGSRIAAIDGYAVASATTLGGSDYSPLILRLQTDRSTRFEAGQARLIQSGERLPDQADAVLPLDSGEIYGDTLEAAASVACGAGVIGAGEEYAADAILLEAGHCLRAQDLGLLAQTGLDRVPVQTRPRVLLLLAGRFEHDANGPMLHALVQADGGEVVGQVRVSEAGAFESALYETECDLVIVAGATGQGDNDFAVDALARVGEVAIYGVAIHPGDSAALGRRDSLPVLLLPGTPLACLCAYDLLGARALRRMGRQPGVTGYASRQLRLTRKIASAIGRLQVCRVRLSQAGAEPLAIAEDRLLASAVGADGFVLVPEQSEGYPAATEVRVFLYHGTVYPSPEENRDE